MIASLNKSLHLLRIFLVFYLLKDVFSQTLVSSTESQVQIVDSYESYPSSPVVQTDIGVLHGKTYQESHAFYGVPYAVPPVGNLRFQPPAKFVQNASETVNASTPNFVACQQIVYDTCDNGACVPNVSEDCLVLNIFVPSAVKLSNVIEAPLESLPVMVYFHGGSFYLGSGTAPLYNGREMSNHTNTIIVTVNYRLGPFGFLHYDDGFETIGGNQGMEDQRLALSWVKENIAKFGGNKSMVTIFGQSAGAQSVLFHLISKKSFPYFHRAIIQSPPALINFTFINESRIITESLMTAVNCMSFSIACLRNVEAESLANAVSEVSSDALFRNSFFDLIEPFRPMVDGVELKEQPLTHFEQGMWSTDKDILLGVTAEEAAARESQVLDQNIFYTANDFYYGSVGTNVSHKYEEIAENTNLEGNYPAIAAVQDTDGIYVCPTRALARFISATSRTGQVYLYNYTYSMSGPSCESVLYFDFLCGRAFHTSELVFLFRSGPEYGYQFTEEDIEMADLFSLYWGNFAYFGNPDPSRLWLEYNSNTSRDLNLVLSPPIGTISGNFHGMICNFWDSLGLYPSPEISNSIPEDFTTEPSQTNTNDNGGVGQPTIQKIIFIFMLVLCLIQTF